MIIEVAFKFIQIYHSILRSNHNRGTKNLFLRIILGLFFIRNFATYVEADHI
jgi:hypothetical protein